MPYENAQQSFAFLCQIQVNMPLSNIAAEYQVFFHK